MIRKARLLSVSALLLLLSACVTPTPKLAPPAGTYTCPETVTVTDPRNGSQIFYTTDGSTPTTSSSKYTGPFLINNTDTVRAIAISPGSKISRIATVAYTCTPMTRGQFAVMIAKTFSLPTPTHMVSFPDVTPNDPIYSAVQAAAPYMNEQVLCPNCYLRPSFFPSSPILQEVAALTVVRILAARSQLTLPSATEANNVLANVLDAGSLPGAARPYFAAAIQRQILVVTPAGSAGLKLQLTPAQVTGIIKNVPKAKGAGSQ